MSPDALSPSMCAGPIAAPSLRKGPDIISFIVVTYVSVWFLDKCLFTGSVVQSCPCLLIHILRFNLQDAPPPPPRPSLFHSLSLKTRMFLTYRVCMFPSFPVEILQSLVSGSLGGALGPAVSSPGEQEGPVGPVSLPRRAETFGGFDSHQMSASKGQWL